MTLLSGNPHPEDSTFCLLWLVVQKPKPWGNCAAKNHGPYLRQNNFIEASIFGKIKKEREMGFVNVDFMVVFLKATITIVVIAIAKIIPAVAGNEY